MEVSDRPSILAAFFPEMKPLLHIEQEAGWAPGCDQCGEDGKLLIPHENEFRFFGLPARGLISKQFLRLVTGC